MHSPVKIILDQFEMTHSGYVGFLRRLECVTRKRVDQPGRGEFKNGYWENDIQAAFSERAVAKFLDIPWTGSIGSFKGADIDPDIQVRWTPYENGKLIIRPGDADNHKFVLVTGDAPEYIIHGWMFGAYGKNTEWAYNKNGGAPCFMIPREYLWTPQDLKNSLGRV